MWMSEAPRLSESTSSTFVSLMTGAASADFARLPRSISSSSVLTVSTSASASPIESRSISERPPIAAMSSTLRVGPSRTSLMLPPRRPAGDPVAASGGRTATALTAQLQRTVRPVVLVDRFLEGRLGGHDRLHVVAGHELDVVHGEHVGRVGHGDGERGPGTRERQDLVLARRLGGDDLDDGGVHLEVVEVDRRDAILARKQARDLFVLDEPQADEGLPDLASALLRVVQRVLELLRGNHVLLQQQLTESDGHSVSSQKNTFLRLFSHRMLTLWSRSVKS